MIQNNKKKKNKKVLKSCNISVNKSYNIVRRKKGIDNMWIRCIQDYTHSVTKRQVLTDGKQYQVIKCHKNEYTIRNDNGKIGIYRKELFEIVD